MIKNNQKMVKNKIKKIKKIKHKRGNYLISGLGIQISFSLQLRCICIKKCHSPNLYLR